LERDLDVLFALHRARWGRQASGFAGRAQQFHREFAAIALERGWLRLRILELDGAPAAALLNFRFGGHEWFYQGGRDPRYDRYSPGFLLQLHAIRSAFEDGLEAYRFLRGGEPYKLRFASHDRGLVNLQLDRLT
jgi:CelD/BcsL family acetyltransferase involved in cellulose biosynthesis